MHNAAFNSFMIMFLNSNASQAEHDFAPVMMWILFFLLLLPFAKQAYCVHVGSSADPSCTALFLACFFFKGLCYRTIQYIGNATKTPTAYINDNL